MYIIDNILVDEAIVHQPFLCDLGACKGACCTVEGGSGAPLLDEEVELVRQAQAVAEEYLSERNKQHIAKFGAVEGERGSMATVCIESKDCVFVFYDEQGVAKCAIEKAYFDGKTDFRKPVSCHLYPIRIADFGGTYLYYDTLDECKPARAHGAQENVTIFEMVRSALERRFGAEWEAKFHEFAERMKNDERQRALWR